MQALSKMLVLWFKEEQKSKKKFKEIVAIPRPIGFLRGSNTLEQVQVLLVEDNFNVTILLTLCFFSGFFFFFLLFVCSKQKTTWAVWDTYRTWQSDCCKKLEYKPCPVIIVSPLCECTNSQGWWGCSEQEGLQLGRFCIENSTFSQSRCKFRATCKQSWKEFQFTCTADGPI